MKLAYVYPEPLPSKKASALQVVRTCAALAGLVDEVYLFAADDRSAPEEVLDYYCLGRCDNLRMIYLRRQLGPVTSSALFNVQLRRCLAQIQPRAVLTRHLQVAAGCEWPVVFEAHQFFRDKPGAKSRVLRLERELFDRADAVAFLTAHLQARVSEAVRISCPQAVIPSGTTMANDPIEKPFHGSVRDLVYAGSTRYRWKGIHVLLKAMEMLPQACLHLIGPLEGLWQEGNPYLRDCESRGMIRLYGYLPPVRIPEALKRFEVAVVPNTGDDANSCLYTSPLKLLEYMASSMAIVASDLPSIRELIGAGEAMLVEPGNPRALADAVALLLENPDHRKRLAGKARERVREYSWENRARKFVQLIEHSIPCRG